MRKTVQDNAATGRAITTEDLLRLMDSHDALSRAAPTPPPGLLEAVAQVDGACGMCGGKRVRRTSCSMCHDSTWDHECDDKEVPCHWTGHAVIDQIRVAFDAAKGGEALVHCPGCKQQAPVTEIHTRCTMCAAHEDERTRNAALEESPDAEDAATYRAAVERLDDRAGKAKAAHDAWGSDPEGAVARWVLYGDGEAPAPREVLDKARVVEVLRESRDRHLKAAQERAGTSLEMDHRAMADACTQVATRLGLTLATPPSGPGGGERAMPNVETPFTPEQRDALNAMIQASPLGSRARIAPTPTQDEALTAALVAVEMPATVEEAEQVMREAGVDPAAFLAETMAHAEAVKARLASQPSAPDVVWEHPDNPELGIRVLADGTMQDGTSHPQNWRNIAKDIARALAEAKRETVPVLNALRQYQHRDERCLTETLTRLVDERVTLPQKAWREAAESMRERAETLAYSAAAHCKDQGHKEVLLAVGHRIADLPLEEK